MDDYFAFGASNSSPTDSKLFVHVGHSFHRGTLILVSRFFFFPQTSKLCVGCGMGIFRVVWVYKLAHMGALDTVSLNIQRKMCYEVIKVYISANA